MIDLAVLISEIEQELALLQELIIQIQQLQKLIQESEDQDVRNGLVSGLALYLHSFYTGVERIFYDIARDVDRELPTGSSWHEQLLDQMNVEVPSVRRSVITEQTRLELDEFRRFRHVVRSRYAHQLNPDRVLELAQKLVDVSEYLLQDCQQFCVELRSFGQNQDIQS